MPTPASPPTATALTITQVAEAISGHQFAAAYPYLRDDVQWNLINTTKLEGKTSVIDYCTESAAYLAGVPTTFTRFTTIVGDDRVVIDSEAEYLDPQQPCRIASCDIYRFVEGKVAEITSYCIELSK